MMEDTSTLGIELKDSILVVTINRPDKLNALNETVLKELKATLMAASKHSLNELKGMLLTGAGEKSFIAGADVAAMSSMTPEESYEFGKLGQEVTLLFEKSPFPVIACVNGFALGGGLEMAMSCDFIYGTMNSIYGQPEVKIGLIPGFGGTQRLSRYVGVGRCREMIYTGKNITAPSAKEFGLVNELFETKEEMLEAAMKTLSMIKRNSPLAISKCKDLINEGECLNIEKGLELERENFKSIFKTEDSKEGMVSFLEKRNPHYKGI